MKSRTLANCLDNPVSYIVETGADFLKREVGNYIHQEHYNLHISRKIHIHDMEFYNLTYNCLGVSATSLIENAENFHDAMRKLFRSLVNLTNCQSGGIGIVDFDTELSLFINDETDAELQREFHDFFEDLNLFIRKGCEKAYITLNFGLCTTIKGVRLSNALLDAYGDGNYIFPNLVFKVKGGINRYKFDQNYELFIKSCKITSKCMNPTYLNMDSSFNKNINHEKFGIMGCRSRIADNIFGSEGALRRGNVAAVSINLVQIALESNGNFDKFYENLSKYMDISSHILKNRFFSLIKNGHFSHLIKNDLYIDSKFGDAKMFLKHGTLSIGFIGLWDSISVLLNIKKMTIEHIIQNYNNAFDIVKFMRDKVESYTSRHNFNFSLLASSGEGISGFFFNYDKANYHVNEKIYCEGYYTNSFHIPVYIDINLFDKIKLEAPFHSLCNGGHITYVELKEIPIGNYHAIRELVDYAISQNCGYFGINFPLDYCVKCGFRGAFDESCPLCGCNKIRRLRRVSGYLSEIDSFSDGKKAELANRKAHLETMHF